MAFETAELSKLDSSGNDNHILLQSGQGVHFNNNCLSLGCLAYSIGEDNIGGYSSIPHHEDFQIKSGITLETFLHWQGNIEGPIFRKKDDYLIVAEDNKFKFITWYWLGDIKITDSMELKISELFPSANQWYHVAAVYDPLTLEKIIYINGNKVGSEKVSFAPDSASTDLYFGFKLFQDVKYLEGILDEVAVYNRVLSEQEIRTNCSRVSIAVCKPIIIDED